jgi:hypothetical protein
MKEVKDIFTYTLLIIKVCKETSWHKEKYTFENHVSHLIFCLKNR